MVAPQAAAVVHVLDAVGRPLTQRQERALTSRLATAPGAKRGTSTAVTPASASRPATVHQLGTGETALGKVGDGHGTVLDQRGGVREVKHRAPPRGGLVRRGA